jgi:diadenosine tetraphosphatase ApaH/serine/threonine PP2A family protein phosphatase
MRFAIISDIHSNAEALAAVLADIEGRGIDRIFCLGDVVGYGPDPESCVDTIRARTEFCLLGNHDKALFFGADRFNPYARAAIDWTRERLKPGFLRAKAQTQRWRYLEELLIEKKIGDLYFVHGSPRDQVNEYIYREDIFFNADGKLKEIFALIDRILFCGHTHLPMVVTEQMRGFTPADGQSEFRLSPATKYIINVGSVGQPRDKDVRSCYVEIDGDIVKFHRVRYDFDAVIEKISRISALDPILGTRLREGM